MYLSVSMAKFVDLLKNNLLIVYSRHGVLHRKELVESVAGLKLASKA